MRGKRPKTIHRKDNPNKVDVYAKGGGIPKKKRPPKKPSPPRLDRAMRNYREKIPPKELD